MRKAYRKKEFQELKNERLSTRATPFNMAGV